MARLVGYTVRFDSGTGQWLYMSRNDCSILYKPVNSLEDTKYILESLGLSRQKPIVTPVYDYRRRC